MGSSEAADPNVSNDTAMIARMRRELLEKGDGSAVRFSSTRPHVPLSAVSSLGGFRTPALGARGTLTHWAGIRNPSPTGLEYPPGSDVP
jgi:hypothetical protein